MFVFKSHPSGDRYFSFRRNVAYRVRPKSSPAVIVRSLSRRHTLYIDEDVHTVRTTTNRFLYIGEQTRHYAPKANFRFILSPRHNFQPSSSKIERCICFFSTFPSVVSSCHNYIHSSVLADITLFSGTKNTKNSPSVNEPYRRWMLLRFASLNIAFQTV